MQSGQHVIATAGHVDHGKSSLVRQLTGRDPDRFAEEKRRGLTLDLGFAWLELPSGWPVAFVDVPGHRRYVRTALAGLAPAGLVLFVVAADEGWKLQSEEHLAIIDLLGVSGGVIALAKCDRVPAPAILRVREEVRARVAGTVLAQAPIVEVSSTTGAGLDELLRALDETVARAPMAPPGTSPRLWVDRAFSVTGSGTVVTGTLMGGNLREDLELEVQPGGLRVTIRELQSHDARLEQAVPVSRVAINLRGIDRKAIGRGDHLGLPGMWHAATHADVSLRSVRDLRVGPTDRGAYMLHVGTTEVPTRLRHLGSRPEAESSFARLSLGRPIALSSGDRFILRDLGRSRTVAGGEVLEPDPPQRRGRDATELLDRLAGTPVDGRPALLLEARGVRRDERGWSVSEETRHSVEEAVSGLLRAAHDDPRSVRRSGVEAVIRQALHEQRLTEDHGLVTNLFDEMVRSKVVVARAKHWELPDASSHTDPHHDDLIAAVANDEPTPPTIDELVDAGIPMASIEAAVESEELVRISPNLVITPHLDERARTLLVAHAPITVSAFRERLGTSRRFAVPMLEYYDRVGFTRRVEDTRVLTRIGPTSPP